MMTIRQFLLVKLAEEAAEVAQRALKAAQFGPDEVQVGQERTNAERLYMELSDLHAVERMVKGVRGIKVFPVGYDIDAAYNAKREKMQRYLRLSQELGQVEAGSI